MRNRFPESFVCFFGHTHVPVILDDSGTVLSSGDKTQMECEVLLRDSKRYLINPGSVGQPRDGVPLASFGVLDEETYRYVQYRIPYNISQTKKKIMQAGLPCFLADRLGTGR